MDPLTVMQAGVTNKVPVMMGLTETHFVFNQVSNMLHTPYLLKHLNHHWRKVFPLIFEYNKFYTNFSEESQNMISKQVRKFYFHGKSIDENQGEFLKQALSDRLFRSGMKQTIKLLAKHGPVYPFILASPKKSLNNGLPWIAGFDDGRSVLSNSMKTVMGYEKAVQAEKLLNIIQKLIVSFAKNKRPVDQTGGENPWNALDPSKISSQKPLMYYRIGLETTLVPEPFTAGVDFWEKTLRKAKKKNIG
ncbi:unnamed protein product [Allacma fusca]|uniref:Carboxylesterase type B domain-containing protein n=1 Tax=Allacma fusca TaxID=39272 RepID=A0A8J2K9P5_9HEXA|nr:unnamed protein product [Allacma fusca]